MAFDATGNLYVAEWGAGRVSRIDPRGRRSTFAEALSGPSGLAIDAAHFHHKANAFRVNWVQTTGVG